MNGHAPRRLSREFNVLGFPTRVRPGFGIFLLLLLVVYPAPLGYWVALAMGAFTLIHELGHALAARQAGCNARISLDFMMAYASYSSGKELDWKQKSFISLAGPSLQIGTAIVALAAMRVNPLSRDDIAGSYASAAVWWAGIALGLLNLVPLLPLDGGALVATIAEHFAPGKGRLAVLYLSFGATIGLVLLDLYIDAVGLMPLFIFMLMLQWQQISQPRRMKALLQDAELQATGDPFLDGMIIDALTSSNEFARALTFSREAYQLCPAFPNAFACATLSLQLGKTEEAIMWLGVAERSQIFPNELNKVLATNARFASLQGLPGVSDQWFTNS